MMSRFFLVTSKRDLLVKISREFKRNIAHIERVCWKFFKMKNRQNDSNNLVLIPIKPRFRVERKCCDVILHECYFQQTCSRCTIFLLNSHDIFTTKSRFDVTRKSVTSSRTRAIVVTLQKSMSYTTTLPSLQFNSLGVFPLPSLRELLRISYL